MSGPDLKTYGVMFGIHSSTLREGSDTSRDTSLPWIMEVENYHFGRQATHLPVVLGEKGLFPNPRNPKNHQISKLVRLEIQKEVSPKKSQTKQTTSVLEGLTAAS